MHCYSCSPTTASYTTSAGWCGIATPTSAPAPSAFSPACRTMASLVMAQAARGGLLLYWQRLGDCTRQLRATDGKDRRRVINGRHTHELLGMDRDDLMRCSSSGSSSPAPTPTPAAMHIEHEALHPTCDRMEAVPGMDVWDGGCDQQRRPALVARRVNAPGTSVPRAEQPDQIVSTPSPAAASSPPRISARQSARCGISGGRAVCAGAGPGIAMAFCSSRSLISMRR